MFPTVQFVITNVPEKRIQELLSQKKLNELLDDSRNILKKSNIDRYSDCLVVESSFCYAESTAYYTIHNKPDHSFEYQPHEFQDKLVE